MMNQLILSNDELKLIHRALGMKIQSIDFQSVGLQNGSVEHLKLRDESTKYIQLIDYVENVGR